MRCMAPSVHKPAQVVLNFSFSAMKAMNNAMKKDSGARCGEGDRLRPIFPTKPSMEDITA